MAEGTNNPIPSPYDNPYMSYDEVMHYTELPEPKQLSLQEQNEINAFLETIKVKEDTVHMTPELKAFLKQKDKTFAVSGKII